MRLFILSNLFIFLLSGCATVYNSWERDIAQSNVFQVQSDFLSKEVTDFEIRLGEEYMGPTAFGRISGSEIKLLGYLETDYTNSPSEFAIKTIAVQPYAQGRGVAHALVEFTLKRYEKLNNVSVKKIIASSYVGGNLDPMLARFINALKNKTGFIKPEKNEYLC